METFVSIFAPVFGIGLYLYMTIGTFTNKGIFKNYFSTQCTKAAAWQKVLGSICQVGAWIDFYLLASDTITVSTGLVILMGVLVAFGWFASAGFYVGYSEE